jgi:hypothetical protein
MAKTDYAYAKRQRDIAKRLKKEEKKKLKAEAKELPSQQDDETADTSENQAAFCSLPPKY